MIHIFRITLLLCGVLAAEVASAGPSEGPLVEFHAGPYSTRQVEVEAIWYDPETLNEQETAQDIDLGGEAWNGAVSLNRPGSFSEASQVSRVNDFTIEARGSAYVSTSTYVVDYGLGPEETVGFAKAETEFKVEFSVPVQSEFSLQVKFKFDGSYVSNSTAQGAVGLSFGAIETDCPRPAHWVVAEFPDSWSIDCKGTAPADQKIIVSALVKVNAQHDTPGDILGSFEFFLSFIEDLPTIDKIHVESAGVSLEDPETGKDVTLFADLTTPTPFEIQSCTWTGNNFTGSGMGDKEDNCRWKYKPQKGEGPRRDTYGAKNVNLTVVYDYDTYEAAVEVAKRKDYKVFFSKKGDDDSNSQPNWFDYWGNDGAVPGLDDSNVNYNAGINAIAQADFPSRTVIFGSRGGDADGSITVPATPDCPGGTFPGANGIDLAAISLAHEHRHNELDALGGTDTDGDDVPDSVEADTSSTNPDSCNLAGVIHSDYSTYGDNEFVARQAELGVSGLTRNDWAVPGRQAKLKTLGSTATTKHTNPARSSTSFSTSSPASRGGGGNLTNNYSVSVMNSDGDALNNSMTIDVGVSTLEAGDYSVSVWLTDDSDEPLIGLGQDVALGLGSATIQILFDGPVLERLGVMQPFKVSRVEFYARVGKHLVLQDAADDVLVTGYDSEDFDPPAATLTSVLSESAEDTDDDGLFDSLDITVEVAIHEPGQYQLAGQLGGTNLSLAAGQSINVASGGVVEQVILSFSGPGVFYYREDGPWILTHLDLVSVPGGDPLDSLVDAWTTAGFLHTEFQQTGVAIDETSYSDSGGELDDDSKHETLDVMVNIDSSDPGIYRLLASLEDETGNTIASSSQLIALGGTESAVKSQSALIQFNGTDISASGIDGPWRLAAVTLISGDGMVVDQNPAPYTTLAYEHDQFSAAPIADELIFADGFE